MRPVIVIGDVVPDAARQVPPSSWYSYPVTAEPPLLVGAVKASWRKWLPGVTVPIVGADGAASGVAATGLEALPVPAAFLALTLKK